MGCMALTHQYDYQEIKAKIALEKKDWIILGSKIYSVMRLMSNQKHNPHKAVIEALIGKEVSRYVYCGIPPYSISNCTETMQAPHAHEERYMREMLRAKIGNVKYTLSDICRFTNTREETPIFKAAHCARLNTLQNGYRVCLFNEYLRIKTLANDVRYAGMYFLFKQQSKDVDKANKFRIFGLSLNFESQMYEQLCKYAKCVLNATQWKPLYANYESIQPSKQLNLLVISVENDKFVNNMLYEQDTTSYEIEGPIGEPFGIDMSQGNSILAIVDCNRIIRWLDLIVYIFRHECESRHKSGEYSFIADSNLKSAVNEKFMLVVCATNCTIYECKLIKLIGEIFEKNKWGGFKYISCKDEPSWPDVKGPFSQAFIDTIPTTDIISGVKGVILGDINDSTIVIP